MLVVEVAADAFDQRDQRYHIIILPCLVEAGGTFQPGGHTGSAQLQGDGVCSLIHIQIRRFLSFLGSIVIHPDVLLEAHKRLLIFCRRVWLHALGLKFADNLGYIWHALL